MRVEQVRALLAERFEAATGPLPERLRFVDDHVVDYGFPEKIYVRERDLFGLDELARWDALLAPGTGWIHFKTKIEGASLGAGREASE